jgi:FtsP/CotA-like multicopper oxidase with cupredoxin domain
MGRWTPEAADGPRLVSAVFAQNGGEATVPGPLIRGEVGNFVRATVCNALPDTVWIAGLAGDEGRDTVPVAPGERATFPTVLTTPGTRIFDGLVRTGQDLGGAEGGQLVGLLRATRPDLPREDEILLITGWGARADDDNDTPFAMLVNGRSWPHTQRLHYTVGDTARWVVANTADAEHPMHLHGFHFLVTARGGGKRDTLYTPHRRRLAVTETIFTNHTMEIEWVPERGGRWIFHCHFTAHMDGSIHDMIAGRPPGDVHHDDDPEDHVQRAMAGLVVGIEVAGDPALGLDGTDAVRRERIVVQARDATCGAEPGYGYVLQRDRPPERDSVEIPGSRIDARVGQPIEINVVNHLDQRTAVHWHGLEIESYYDGVPGWTGDGNRTTPFIEPGDSFLVRIVPVRAGTYMYHSHFDDLTQLGRGLFAPLIVTTDGQVPDAAADHTIIFSMAGTSDESPVVANNGASPAVRLAAGHENRIRFINITADDVVRFALLDGDSAATWRVVANDGADLPLALTGPVAARMILGAGETADVLIVPRRDLRLDVKSYNDFVARIGVTSAR